MGNEFFGECRFLTDYLNDCGFFQSRDDGVGHGRDRCNALRLPGETSLAEEFVSPKNCYDGLFALLGNDGELRLAFLNVEDSFGSVPL